MNTNPLVILLVDEEHPIIVLKEWEFVYVPVCDEYELFGYRSGFDNIKIGWYPTHVMLHGDFVTFEEWKAVQLLRECEELDSNDDLNYSLGMGDL